MKRLLTTCCLLWMVGAGAVRGVNAADLAVDTASEISTKYSDQSESMRKE